ncbi:hypothetical protein GCM10023186_43010 [Hymenobacter koreensis]|uniref:Glycosyltransferase RgtA/B/C/D-like domain-containing protein n=1 Tax=Hymenobacter koreensis TaxID=1084523 RepID=A0ABP8JKZ2_9BACT
MRLWDESRLGVNALEMLASGNLLVTQYSGHTDLWNNKPPLLIWLQVLSMQGLGASLTSLRVPTALAVLATVLVVYIWGRRWLGTSVAGLAAGLMLLSTPGYAMEHVTLTADYEALLILWTTLFSFYWLDYLATGRPGAARLTGVFVLLAVLTKGIAGLLMLPGLLLFTLVAGRASYLLRPAVWQAVALVALGVLGWYGLREWAEPGYLAAVWRNELYGRASEAIEGHVEPLHFYFSMLMRRQYYWWLLPTVVGWAIGLRQPRESRPWLLAWFTLFVPLGLLLVLTLVPTKLEWYSAPVYPLLVLGAALGLQRIAQRFGGGFPGWLAWPAVLLIVAVPYVKRLRYASALIAHEQSKLPALTGRHIEQQAHALPQVRHYGVVTNRGYAPQYVFYRLLAARRHAHQADAVNYSIISEQPAGRVVAACGRRAQAQWQQGWNTRVLFRTDSCATLRLLSKPGYRALPQPKLAK